MSPSPSETASAFARALDHDDFEHAARFIDGACVYDTGGTQLSGPAAILASYAEASAWGRAHLDEVVFRSEVIAEEGPKITILFTDLIASGTLRHVYRTHQVLTVGPAGTIVHIVGIELPGERENLDAFFRRAGLVRKGAEARELEPRALTVRELGPSDGSWLRDLLVREWGSGILVSRGRVHDAGSLPGIVAIRNSERAGVILWREGDGELEVVLVHSLYPREGIGSRLLDLARREALAARCTRIWLVTTNDNETAREFYRRRGWQLVAVHRGAMREARRLKPEIPLTGANGIPIEDEIEFALDLEPRA